MKSVANGRESMRYWSSPGSRAPAGRVRLLNFDEPAKPGDQFGKLRDKMASYQSQFIAGASREAMVDAYHTVVLPRFCYLAARSWFDTLR